MGSLKFLHLPGEIRNQIYHQLLILPSLASLSSPKHLDQDPLYPQILQTCRKIYEEARQILYGCNTFIAHPNLLSGMPRLRKSFDTISHPNLISMIRRFYISVRLDCDPNFSAQKAREAFSGVDELTLDVFQAQFGSSDFKVLRLFEKVRGVKRARVCGSISGFPEYAKWLVEAMMTAEGIHLERFVEGGERTNVRAYDIWIVSGNLTSVVHS